MTYSRLLEEVNQGHHIRKELYQDLERELRKETKKNIRVVAFFSSFRWAVLQDEDADMLEEVLRNSRMNGKRLVLVLNSAGGEALPAERIVNICRNYSQDGFSVIVPKMAKSAATMICFGADSIGMSKTSELGPIDPQIPIEDEKGRVMKYLAAHEIIESYRSLMRQANATRGRVDPYLQQLARFDARDIRRIVSAQEVSASIAVNCLRSGMLSGRNANQIRAKIKPFLDPRYTKVHGRPIYYDVARKCGLKVDLYDSGSSVWHIVWNLYVRLNYLVAHNVLKAIESSEDLYTASVPPQLAMLMGQQ